MSLFDSLPNIYHSPFCNIGFEEKSSYGFADSLYHIPNIPTFSKKDENYSFNLCPSFDNAIVDSWKDNFENLECIYKEQFQEGNSCNNFFIHELPEKINSNKSNNFSFESHCDTIEIKISSNSVNSMQKKDVFISKVNNSHQFQLFVGGKFDDYSWKKISEVLTEIRTLANKKRIRNKNPKKRKERNDNIQKKIKGKFFKPLKNLINQILRDAGSVKFFGFFPQYLICDLIKEEKNKAIFDLSLEDIFSVNFNYPKSNKKAKKQLQKFKQNNEMVLRYLDKNINIGEKSNFNLIKKLKLSELFKQYINSKEFGKAISSLKQENQKYTYLYIIKAYDFLKMIKK